MLARSMGRARLAVEAAGELGVYRGLVPRLLTPRWIGLHLLALLLVASFLRLGWWQWNRAQESVAPITVSTAPAVPVSSLARAGSGFPDGGDERTVTAEGIYDQLHTWLVPGRAFDGVLGSWLVTPLRQSDGSGVVIVRGWIPTDAGGTPRVTVPAVPAGAVTITGALLPPEPYADPPAGLTGSSTASSSTVDSSTASVLGAVSTAQIANQVSYPVLTGFVLSSSSAPAEAAQLRPVPLPALANHTNVPYWQHVSYVVLWWIFAVFTVAFWIRLARTGPPDTVNDDTVNDDSVNYDTVDDDTAEQSADDDDAGAASTLENLLPREGTTPL